MTADEILEQLTHPPQRLPEEALRAAEQFRAELTPHLLESLVAAATQPELLEEDPTIQLPFFAMYLLAIWREPAAFPLSVNFLRLPGEQAMEVAGDIVTYDMPWMLTQTCAGRTDQIEALAIDRKVNEWSRAAAVNALTCITQQGGQSQEALREQFRRIIEPLREPHPEGEGEFGDAVTLATVAGGVLDLQLVALRKDILTLFDRRRIDDSMVTRELFDEELGTLEPKPPRAPVTDVVDALSWWDFETQTAPRSDDLEIVDDEEDEEDVFETLFNSTSEDHSTSEELIVPVAPTLMEPAVPFRAPPKVGRNDPCPCGSGKKYKKCCSS